MISIILLEYYEWRERKVVMQLLAVRKELRIKPDFWRRIKLLIIERALERELQHLIHRLGGLR